MTPPAAANLPANLPEGSRAIVRQRKRPENDLVQLVYVSSAAPSLTACDLHAIAVCSESTNGSLGLTGFLLCNGGHFYGVLEGPRRRVFERMEQIIVDRRHSALHVLREQTIETRRFENWSFSALPAPVADLRAGEGPEDFIRSLTRRLK